MDKQEIGILLGLVCIVIAATSFGMWQHSTSAGMWMGFTSFVVWNWIGGK